MLALGLRLRLGAGKEKEKGAKIVDGMRRTRAKHRAEEALYHLEGRMR